MKVALANLVALRVMEQVGPTVRLAEPFSSELKAHPGHPQNRGEKACRVRLLQHLEGLQGGQR